MSAKAVQVSIDRDLLRQVDKDPDTRRFGRSHVIRSALRLYLEAKHRREIDSAIARAYSGHEQPMLREIEGLLEKQAWPEE